MEVADASKVPVSETSPTAADCAALSPATTIFDKGAVSNIKAPLPKKWPWRDVAVVKRTSASVTQYHSNDEQLVPLASGQAYKFRVSGINACGRGHWSEVSAFKTCLPGFPSCPQAVKILKNDNDIQHSYIVFVNKLLESPSHQTLHGGGIHPGHGDGAHITWEAPLTPKGLSLEYSVYLAVKSNSQAIDEKKGQKKLAPLAFVRVYQGVTTMCLVGAQSLATAHIDYNKKNDNGKPSLVFRLAAKNHRGYGPAVQVRWLQDPKALPQPAVATAAIALRSATNFDGIKSVSILGKAHGDALPNPSISTLKTGDETVSPAQHVAESLIGKACKISRFAPVVVDSTGRLVHSHNDSSGRLVHSHNDSSGRLAHSHNDSKPKIGIGHGEPPIIVRSRSSPPGTEKDDTKKTMTTLTFMK